MSDVDEKLEQSWTNGNRSAWLRLLHQALRELGYKDTEATRAKWVCEREAAVAALRSFCKHWGDNDWAPDLNLSDVIEKHLRNYIEDNSVKADPDLKGD